MARQRFPMSLKTLFSVAQLAKQFRDDPNLTKDQAVKTIEFFVPTVPESSESLQQEELPLPYGEAATLTAKEVTRAQVRLHRVLGRRFFATKSGTHSGFAVTDHTVDTFLRHVDDLLDAYNALVEGQLGLVDVSTFSTFTSTIKYVLPIAMKKLLRKIGVPLAGSAAVTEETFSGTCIQEIRVDSAETTWDAIRKVRERKSAFALVTLEDSFRIHGKKEAQNGTTTWNREGVIAEQLPFVEPELGLIYLKSEEKVIFGTKRGSGKYDLAAVLARTPLILHGDTDTLSELLRRLHRTSVQERATPGEATRNVVFPCPTFQHAKSLVEAGIGIGVGEAPFNEGQDPEACAIGFKSFSDFVVPESMKTELAAAIKPIRYALYYHEDWDLSTRDGGILPIMKVLMGCIREACRNDLKDVCKPLKKREEQQTREASGLFRDFDSPLVFKIDADKEQKLVAKLTM